MKRTGHSADGGRVLYGEGSLGVPLRAALRRGTVGVARTGVHSLDVSDLLPADPLELGRRLAFVPGFALLASSAPRSPRGRFSYLGAAPSRICKGRDPLAGSAAVGCGLDYPEYVGLLPYEAERARLERPAYSQPELRDVPSIGEPIWGRFDAVARVDHEDQRVLLIGQSTAAIQKLHAQLQREPEPWPEVMLAVLEPEPAAVHAKRVERAIELIFAGDLYQVNLARRLRLRLTASRPDGSPRPVNVLAYLALLRQQLQRSQTPFGTLLQLQPEGPIVLGTSPELLLDATPSADGTSFLELSTEPIKGTRPRGETPEQDERLARDLEQDPKERAELSMIVDVERNDLARIAQLGSVQISRAAEVRAAGPVWHRSAELTALARPDLSREDVLRSIVPSGSVTGAPKVRAMEVIAQLESVRRGLYTGGVGYLSARGQLRLAMAIRTAVFDAEGHGEYLVGGGIVADSCPQREVEETNWKAAQLRASVATSSREQDTM